VLPEIPVTGAPSNGTDPHRSQKALQLLWNQRQFLGRVLKWGALFSLVTALLIPASYDGRTALMPPDTQSPAIGLLSSLSSGSGSGALSMGADLLGLKSSGALFISLLRSETLQDDLINRFDLRRVYWVKTYRAAREKLASRTSIDEERKSGVITITVVDHEASRAAALARAYVEELNHLVSDLNTSAAHRERVFLEERLKVVKADLDQSALELSVFSRKNTTIDIKQQGQAMVEAAATLQGQIIATESELRGLEQIYTPNNVRVRAVSARITELKRQLEKLGGSSAEAATETTAPDSMYPSIRQLPALSLKYSDLYRRVKINEAVFEALTRQYELARVEEAKQVPSVKVIDVAQPPEKRSGPPRLLILLGGTLLALTLGSVWIFGSYAWTQSDPADPRRILAEEVATSVSRRLRWSRAREASLKVVSGRLWARTTADQKQAE
jgi:uncharacterized protein involved in exopolysaccharide biosynthesis